MRASRVAISLLVFCANPGALRADDFGAQRPDQVAAQFQGGVRNALANQPPAMGGADPVALPRGQYRGNQPAQEYGNAAADGLSLRPRANAVEPTAAPRAASFEARSVDQSAPVTQADNGAGMVRSVDIRGAGASVSESGQVTVHFQVDGQMRTANVTATNEGGALRVNLTGAAATASRVVVDSGDRSFVVQASANPATAAVHELNQPSQRATAAAVLAQPTGTGATIRFSELGIQNGSTQVHTPGGDSVRPGQVAVSGNSVTIAFTPEMSQAFSDLSRGRTDVTVILPASNTGRAMNQFLEARGTQTMGSQMAVRLNNSNVIRNEAGEAVGIQVNAAGVNPNVGAFALRGAYGGPADGGGALVNANRVFTVSQDQPVTQPVQPRTPETPRTPTTPGTPVRSPGQPTMPTMVQQPTTPTTPQLQYMIQNPQGTQNTPPSQPPQSQNQSAPGSVPPPAYNPGAMSAVIPGSIQVSPIQGGFHQVMAHVPAAALGALGMDQAHPITLRISVNNGPGTPMVTMQVPALIVRAANPISQNGGALVFNMPSGTVLQSAHADAMTNLGGRNFSMSFNQRAPDAIDLRRFQLH